MIVRERHTVARGDLRRQPERGNLPRFGLPRLDALVGGVVPARGIAGIAVRENPGDDVGVTPAAEVAEEPEPVALDRAAEAAADIPVGAERGRPGDPEGTQAIVDVVGCRPVPRGAVEGSAAEVVAARLRDD